MMNLNVDFEGNYFSLSLHYCLPAAYLLLLLLSTLLLPTNFYLLLLLVLFLPLLLLYYDYDYLDLPDCV